MGPLKVPHWGQGRNLRRHSGVLREPDTPVGKASLTSQPVLLVRNPEPNSGLIGCRIRSSCGSHRLPRGK
eukprot:7487202-Pyramimonas_sp.AAC.1